MSLSFEYSNGPRLAEARAESFQAPPKYNRLTGRREIVVSPKGTGVQQQGQIMFSTVLDSYKKYHKAVVAQERICWRCTGLPALFKRAGRKNADEELVGATGIKGRNKCACWCCSVVDLRGPEDVMLSTRDGRIPLGGILPRLVIESNAGAAGGSALPPRTRRGRGDHVVLVSGLMSRNCLDCLRDKRSIPMLNFTVLLASSLTY